MFIAGKNLFVKLKTQSWEEKQPNSQRISSQIVLDTETQGMDNAAQEVIIEIASTKQKYSQILISHSIQFLDTNEKIIVEADGKAQEFNYEQACLSLKITHRQKEAFLPYEDVHSKLEEDLEQQFGSDCKPGTIGEKIQSRAKLFLKYLPVIFSMTDSKVIRIKDLPIKTPQYESILRKRFEDQFSSHFAFTTNPNISKCEENFIVENQKYSCQMLYVMETDLYVQGKRVIKLGKTSKNIFFYSQQLYRHHSEKIKFDPIIWFKFVENDGKVIDKEIHRLLTQKFPKEKVFLIGEENTIHREFYYFSEELFEGIIKILGSDTYTKNQEILKSLSTIFVNQETESSSSFISNPKSVIKSSGNSNKKSTKQNNKEFSSDESDEYIPTTKPTRTYNTRQNKKQTQIKEQKEQEASQQKSDHIVSNFVEKSNENKGEYLSKISIQGNNKEKKNGGEQKDNRSSSPLNQIDILDDERQAMLKQLDTIQSRLKSNQDEIKKLLLLTEQTVRSGYQSSIISI